MAGGTAPVQWLGGMMGISWGGFNGLQARDCILVSIGLTTDGRALDRCVVLAYRSVLPIRPNAADSNLTPFPEPETASPEKPAIIRREGVRVERIDRIGLELGTQYKTECHVEENDPLSAVAELHLPRRSLTTKNRERWQRHDERHQR